MKEVICHYNKCCDFMSLVKNYNIYYQKCNYEYGSDCAYGENKGD